MYTALEYAWIKHKLASSVGSAFLSARCRKRRRRSRKSVIHTAANGNTRNSLQRYRQQRYRQRQQKRCAVQLRPLSASARCEPSLKLSLNLSPTPVILIRTRYVVFASFLPTFRGTLFCSFYQLSIVNYRLSTINCQLSTVNCQLSTIDYQLSTINYQLSTINYQLSTINYQLSTINYHHNVQCLLA